MNSTFRFLSLLLLVLGSIQVSFATEPVESLARKAVSENIAASSAAIAELRSLGPAGLAALRAQYAGEINAHITNPTTTPDEQWQRITAALDAVAQQKNSYIAGLYWYTDLDSAKKASKALGKPILSLRLLGKLTDEFSCANSRFFRTVLYPNDEVAAVLRERFVLHWRSVRPVPTVTIDFGDGRKLERTLTGNSIHYILDSQARPLDALPGLYGPRAFLRGLANAEKLFQSLAGKNEQERSLLLRVYYEERHNKISAAWTIDTGKIGGEVPAGYKIYPGKNGTEAQLVASRAITKMATEASILAGMNMVAEELGRITDEAAWKKIAELHSGDAILDGRAIALIQRQNPSLSEDDLTRLVNRFQGLVALDTVRNEYLMHTKLYTWLRKDPARDDVEKLNKKVYDSLFLTPQSDPWLGLFSNDLYTALDNGGVVKQP
ncbi:MAG TPA: hypothetical protein VGQ41_11815 [Pyrinomonadaceae bacterium]|jgi:hypothetical protein|nr:hypothetical protein [Pyrinomonadaceae bacterium]